MRTIPTVELNWEKYLFRVTVSLAGLDGNFDTRIVRLLHNRSGSTTICTTWRNTWCGRIHNPAPRQWLLSDVMEDVIFDGLEDDTIQQCPVTHLLSVYNNGKKVVNRGKFQSGLSENTNCSRPRLNFHFNEGHFINNTWYINTHIKGWKPGLYQWKDASPIFGNTEGRFECKDELKLWFERNVQ